MLFPKKEVVKRYPENPILTANDIDTPFACRAVYNSGITKFNSQYLMLLRVESIDKKQYFWVATSDDGYKFKTEKEPIEIVVDDKYKVEYEEFTGGMIYDPRITKIDNTYYIFYACHSDHGVRIGMAKTEDFKRLYFFGFGSEIENRNGVLFPEKINNLYVRLDRPQRYDGRGNIWISYSPDLIHWGQSKQIAIGDSRWEWRKVGPGAPLSGLRKDGLKSTMPSMGSLLSTSTLWVQCCLT